MVNKDEVNGRTVNRLSAIEREVMAQAGAEEEIKQFGDSMEPMLVPAILDHPPLFENVVRKYMKPQFIKDPGIALVMGHILEAIDKYGITPTRAALEELVLSPLRHENEWYTRYEYLKEIIHRQSDYREVPIVKDLLIKWMKDRAYGLMFAEEAQAAYARGDYETMATILKEAEQIGHEITPLAKIGDDVSEEDREHITTGFAQLNAILDVGGPCKGEILLWMAPTGKGKSRVLCNNAVSAWHGRTCDDGETNAQNVLYISFELSEKKILRRCHSIILNKYGRHGPNVPLTDVHKEPHRQNLEAWIEMAGHTYGSKHFAVKRLPAAGSSVIDIDILISNIWRTERWKPDVIIVDYLDMMVSRDPNYNKSDYIRQREVANELTDLATRENVLIFTATQTNRLAVGAGVDAVSDMNKVADSYGKTFTIDYVISLNQTMGELENYPSQMRFYVAKNRNGPSGITIGAHVWPETMVMSEMQVLGEHDPEAITKLKAAVKD